jgi:hypothetical protein
MESNSSYRTRRDLQVALMTLVKRQSFETVTIRDITDQAHVNHSTFYRYYHSKYDLLRDVLPVMLDGAFATSGTSDEDIIVSGLTWTNAHRSLVRNLFNEVDAMQTYTELLQVLTSVVNTNRLQQVQPGSPLLAHLQTSTFHNWQTKQLRRFCYSSFGSGRPTVNLPTKIYQLLSKMPSGFYYADNPVMTVMVFAKRQL